MANTMYATCFLCLLASTVVGASESITEKVIEPSALAADSGCSLQDDSTCHVALVQGKAEALRHVRQQANSADPVEGTCKVEGNPDMVTGFDQAHTSWLHFFLTFFHLASDETAVSENGDVWLVKSEDVQIQGRYSNSHKGRSLHGVAVSGAVMSNNIVRIGTLRQKVSWNDEEILEEPVSAFSVKDSVNASRSDVFKDDQLHDEVTLEIASGIKLVVKRRVRDLDIQISMLQSSGGQDGQCGNFNGDPSDDTAELIADRFELQVTEDVLLFSHAFASGKESKALRHTKSAETVNPHAQFVAGVTSTVASHACAKNSQPAQIFRGPFDGHSSEFELKTLDPATGTYSTLYTIPYTRTSPRFVDINSCDISPISSIVYCALTLQDGADYLVRVDAEQIEFVAKIPDSKRRYVAGAFGKSGNFHFSEGGRSEVQLATIYGPDGLQGFSDQNDPSLTDYTNLPTTTVFKVADWVSFEADIHGTGKSEWLLGIKNSTAQSGNEAILVDVDSQDVYRLNALGMDVDGSAFGAGWNFRNRIFFASNNGDGVFEVSVESIDIDAKEVTMEKVGSSAKVHFNDGLNCLSAAAPESWDSCLLVTKDILKGSKTRKDCGPPANECKLVYKKNKRTTFCLQTTTTTTDVLALLGECTIYGDPHVIGFDKGPALLSFMAMDSTAQNTMALSEVGDRWLVRSALVSIQGRYNLADTSFYRKVFLRGLAVGGPFLHNNTLLIGGNSNKVFWNHEEILASIPSQYENNLISASIYNGAKLVQDPTQIARAPGIDVKLPLDITLHMTQGKNGLGIKITMPPVKGGQDGLCGNFNGFGADDTAELISTRLGGEIAPKELLFRHPFSSD